MNRDWEGACGKTEEEPPIDAEERHDPNNRGFETQSSVWIVSSSVFIVRLLFTPSSGGPTIRQQLIPVRAAHSFAVA